MKCHSCQKEINPIERIKGNFVCHDNKGNELDNTIYREFGVVICKVEVKFPPQLFCHTTCYILHKNQVSFADKMEKKEVIINCQHCQERIKGRAIEKFLEEKKSKELNKFLVYLHDNKKCWPKWAKANQINPNYFTQAFIYWDGRIDSPIKY